ncbi:hypothetical protein FO519_002257 [Halicephalobus sp. NKZ332]|nr:hypothetical protein FO519_002257 [Halicephalobus sp. NKZ332]
MGVIAYTKPGTGTELFFEWKRKYGPIYTIWIGEIPIVIVTDYNMIMDTFVANADAYTGRFTVLDEVSSLIENLSSDCSADACDLPWRFDVCVGSIINSLLFGYRFEGEKLEEFNFFKKLLSDHMRTIVDPCIMLLVQEVDILKYVFRGSYEMLGRNKKLFFGFFNRQIEEHEKSIDFESLEEPTDYVEAYLREMHKNKEKGIENSFSNRQQLANMCLDLWFAGMETTANTLGFTVLYLLRNPEVVEKMNSEFDAIIGSDRLVTLNDRPSLKFLQAVINESQRMSNLLPQNLIHTTTQDVEISGYKLEKGTCIVPQIGCVLFDEKYFPDPYKFKPERFIDENGNLKKIEQLVPFSVGKRQCLGESLAKMELFLILSNLYNQFEILPQNPKKLPTLRRVPGITWQPVPFKVLVNKRRHV